AGEGALSSMLQSCAPLAVVNIDAAVPAALFAAHLLAPLRSERPRAGDTEPLAPARTPRS
ncbi:MAG: phosphoribosylaminoimidazole carboxylase, partial [Thermoplasmata archaeon]|nr:phosphoribosylaminoimidazole carboxylase [Thermoplasmata archaeon]